MKIIAHSVRGDDFWPLRQNEAGYTFLTAIIHDGVSSVGRKKHKPKRFRAVTAVKELARERVGAPPPAKVVLEKKKKREKHKPTLGKLLGDAE